MREESLRQRLRAATARAHETLDTASGNGRFPDAPSYALFLEFQLCARRSLEHWLAASCSTVLLPPVTTHLIEADLHVLGHPPRLHCIMPSMPQGADPLGAAWVLAGSSLGNRAMLSIMTRSGTTDWPIAFLSDTAMPRYWQELRPLLERRVTQDAAAPAIAAALAAFAIFEAALPSIESAAA